MPFHTSEIPPVEATRVLWENRLLVKPVLTTNYRVCKDNLQNDNFSCSDIIKNFSSRNDTNATKLSIGSWTIVTDHESGLTHIGGIPGLA